MWRVAVHEPEQRREGAVVWLSLPAGEHEFLAKSCRPSRVALVFGASPAAASLGRGVEGRQGGELRQLALVEFVSALQGGEQTVKLQRSASRRIPASQLARVFSQQKNQQSSNFCRLMRVNPCSFRSEPGQLRQQPLIHAGQAKMHHKHENMEREKLKKEA